MMHLRSSASTSESRVANWLCVVCCGFDESLTDCKANFFETSRESVIKELQRWETHPLFPDIHLTLGINYAQETLPLCSSCLALISSIHELETDLREKFRSLAQLLCSKNGVSPLDCVQPTLIEPKEESLEDDGDDVSASKPFEENVPRTRSGVSEKELEPSAAADELNALDDSGDYDSDRSSNSDSSEGNDTNDVDFLAPDTEAASAPRRKRGRPRKSDDFDDRSVSLNKKRQFNSKPNKVKKDSEEFPCQQCQLRCKSLKALRSHEMNVHGIAKPYSCSQCEKAFSRDSALSRHVKEMHLNQPRAKVSCPHCDKIFTRWNVVRKHANRVHGEPPTVPCKKCGRMFVTTAERRLHAVHCDGTGNVPAELEEEHAVCPICGEVKKGANAQYRLTVHIDGVHKKIKKHKCQLCPAAFEHSRSLLRHESLIHRVRPERYQFPCDVCGKVMQTKRDLELHKFSKHQILERDMEVFTCVHCSKQFLKKQAYELHVRVHEGVKPHACSECEYRASSFGALKNHSRNAHARNIRRVFAEGCKDETIYTIVDVGEGDASNETGGNDIAADERSEDSTLSS